MKATSFYYISPYNYSAKLLLRMFLFAAFHKSDGLCCIQYFIIVIFIQHERCARYYQIHSITSQKWKQNRSQSVERKRMLIPFFFIRQITTRDDFRHPCNDRHEWGAQSACGQGRSNGIGQSCREPHATELIAKAQAKPGPSRRNEWQQQ